MIFKLKIPKNCEGFTLFLDIFQKNQECQKGIRLHGKKSGNAEF